MCNACVMAERKTNDKKPKVAKEADRRAFFANQLDSLIAGDNLLTFKLDRKVKLSISDEEREALLTRSLKVPTGGLEVELLWNGALSVTDTAFLTKKENKMRLAPKSPVVSLHFQHFVCPVEDGGWKVPNVENPLFKKWSSFYGLHSERILAGANPHNLKLAHDQSLPIDIFYSKYNGKILRFHLLEPYAEDQVGCKVFIKEKK